MGFFSGSVETHDFVNACRVDPILRRWLRSCWLDPRVLREQAIARPLVRWCSADDFFRTEALDALAEHHARLDFSPDDVGLRYDSRAVRVDAEPQTVGLDLLLHPLWQSYATFAVGGVLRSPGRTVIKYRSHPAWSHGFWIHTDRDPRQPKALAVLGYLNRDWTASDGGLLQLWEVQPADKGDPTVLRWADYADRPLTFLDQATELTIEAADVEGYTLLNARLLDQIVPQFNRVVFLDFQTTASFHSVSPSKGRARQGFLQWLY